MTLAENQTATQASDRRRSTRDGASDRRTARPLRDHVQALFETLRDDLAKDADNARLVMGLKTWRKPEDVMLDCPTLVPLVLEMAWRKREAEAFRPLFVTVADTPAADKTEQLAFSEASYDELLMACLRGAVRITCMRREIEWLTAERAKGSLIGAMMRAVGIASEPRSAKLLKRYSRSGLHEVLKPHLVDADQFDAVEAYAMLSTRAAELLGPRLRGMTDPGVVKTFAGLDAAASKFAVVLADAYVASTADNEDGLDDALAGEADNEVKAGQALTQLLASGTGLLKNALAERKGALAVVANMSGALGDEVWGVLAHTGNIKNLSHCSGPMALGFGVLAAQMDDAVAKVLAGINDDKAARYFAVQLLALCGPDKIAAWIADTDQLSVWKAVVVDLNKQLRRPAPAAPLNAEDKDIIRALCEDVQQRCAPVPRADVLPEVPAEAEAIAVPDTPPAAIDAGTPPEGAPKLAWSQFVEKARKDARLS